MESPALLCSPRASDLASCRAVCRAWRDAIDGIINNNNGNDNDKGGDDDYYKDDDECDRCIDDVTSKEKPSNTSHGSFGRKRKGEIKIRKRRRRGFLAHYVAFHRECALVTAARRGDTSPFFHQSCSSSSSSSSSSSISRADVVAAAAAAGLVVCAGQGVGLTEDGGGGSGGGFTKLVAHPHSSSSSSSSSSLSSSSSSSSSSSTLNPHNSLHHRNHQDDQLTFIDDVCSLLRLCGRGRPRLSLSAATEVVNSASLCNDSSRAARALWHSLSSSSSSSSSPSSSSSRAAVGEGGSETLGLITSGRGKKQLCGWSALAATLFFCCKDVRERTRLMEEILGTSANNTFNNNSSNNNNTSSSNNNSSSSNNNSSSGFGVTIGRAGGREVAVDFIYLLLRSLRSFALSATFRARREEDDMSRAHNPYANNNAGSVGSMRSGRAMSASSSLGFTTSLSHSISRRGGGVRGGGLGGGGGGGGGRGVVMHVSVCGLYHSLMAAAATALCSGSGGAAAGWFVGWLAA